MENTNKSAAALLRQKAEEELIMKSENSNFKYLSDDIQLIIHELQVHQIELEMQNEELVLAKKMSEVDRSKYKELYDFAPSGYLTLTPEGEILELNLQASQMLGKERSNLKNSRLGFFVAEESKPVFNVFLENIVRGDTKKSCEVVLAGLDNNPIIARISGIISDNRLNCYLTAVDITRQELAEEAIKRSEEKYRMLLELASDAFFQGSIKGDFIAVNTAAQELTGYSRDELLQMNMTDLFSADSLQENPPKYEQLNKGETVYSERDLVRKDGKVINIEMNSRIMPNKTYQAFIRDITERKRVEKALKQKLNEMEIYYELAVTREHKMIALKSEINMLLNRLGEKPKY